MPVTLNDFKAFVASGANGNVRLFRGDDSKLVEYGRTGFWKIFHSGYWNEAAFTQENVAIRKAFVTALENSKEFSAERVEAIKNELGVGIIQDDGIAMTALTVDKVKDILEGISFEDAQYKLNHFFKARSTDSESTVILIEDELKLLARQKGAKENDIENTFFSDVDIVKLKEKIKNTLKARFHNYNQRLTIPIEQLEVLKKRGLPVSIYHCTEYRTEYNDGGYITLALNGMVGIEAFDELINKLNINQLFVEADAALYGNEQTRKESLRYQIEDWMSTNIANYEKIPQEERESLFKEIFFQVCTSVQSRMRINKHGEQLNSACQNFGIIRLKTDKPSSKDSDEYKNFLELYKTTINKTNENWGMKDWMINTRVTNNNKYSRMINEIFSWDEQNNTFVFTDSQRRTICRALFDKDQFKPKMILLLSKFLKNFDPFFKLCYSNECIETKDVLETLKTALEKNKQSINDVLDDEIAEKKMKLGITEDDINAIETHYIFKVMTGDYTLFDHFCKEYKRKFSNAEKLTEMDVLTIVKENAQHLLGKTERFETLFGARYEELCKIYEEKNNIEENMTGVEANSEVKNDEIKIKLNDIKKYIKFRDFELDMKEGAKIISLLSCDLGHQLYSLDNNKVGKVWMNQSVKNLLMNIYSEVSPLSELMDVCIQGANNFLNTALGCFNITKDDFVTNNDMLKEKKITKELLDFIKVFGNPEKSQRLMELQQVQSDYMNLHEPTKDEILKERTEFFDWLCEQYSVDDEMRTYAKTLCMADDPTLKNLQPLTTDDKMAIMDIMKKRGVKRFGEANARLNPPLISPEELKANPKYKDMPDIYKNIYESHYVDLTVEGKFSQEKINYCQYLLNTYGNPQDSVIN